MIGLLLVPIFALTICFVWRYRLPLTSPPTLFAFLWILSIIASLVFFYGFPWSYYGLLWIAIAVLTFVMGYRVGKIILEKFKRSSVRPKKGLANGKLLLWLLTGSLVAGIVYVLALMHNYGISVSALFDLEKLADANNLVADNRYTAENPQRSLLLIVLLPFVYLSPLLGGAVFVYVKKRALRLLSVLSILPALGVLLVSNEKAVLILAVIMWVSAYCAVYMYGHATYPRVSRKVGVSIVSFAILGASVLVFSMMLRTGEVNQHSFGRSTEKIANSYLLSQVPAFDNVFNGLSTSGRSFGTYTFYGVANTLGLSERSRGVYADYTRQGDLLTNVYTVFRGMIHDFGYALSVVALGLAGAVIPLLEQATRSWQRRWSAAGIIGIGMMMAFVLFSPIISIFTYASIIVAFVLFYACLVVTIHPEERSLGGEG